VGSTAPAGPGLSTGAGLVRDAIVKVELNPTDTSSYYGTATPSTGGTIRWTSDPADVGPKAVALTGMIQNGCLGTADVDIISNEISDNYLDRLGTVATAAMGVPGGAVAPNQDTWVPFRITMGRLGRSRDHINGPDGTSAYDADDDTYVAYEIDVTGGYAGFEAPDGQSPSTIVIAPEFELPLPTNVGLVVTATGAVQTRNAAAANQTNELWLVDDDDYNDDEIDKRTITVPHPAGIWDGLLIPYSATTTLTINGSGYVTGNTDHSGENPAQIMQYIIEPGWTSNTYSETIDVP